MNVGVLASLIPCVALWWFAYSWVYTWVMGCSFDFSHIKYALKITAFIS